MNDDKASAPLLPCPFCGATPDSGVVYGREEDDPHAFCFECPNGCSVSKEKPTYEEAIKTWNTRSPFPYSGAESFHWKDGWMFARGEAGYVHIWKLENEQPTKIEIAIPPLEWASILASLGTTLPRDAERETIERCARAIAASQGHDPDEYAPTLVMCDEFNNPVQWWKVFEEQTEACLAEAALPSIPSREGAEREAIAQPRVTDNDVGEITVALNGKELRGWTYADDAERRTKMLCAREYVEGWCDGRQT